eukprot:COSAG02_NODE_8691_length_2478_cov_2.289617_2_plen_81_part_00
MRDASLAESIEASLKLSFKSRASHLSALLGKQTSLQLIPTSRISRPMRVFVKWIQGGGDAGTVDLGGADAQRERAWGVGG